MSDTPRGTRNVRTRAGNAGRPATEDTPRRGAAAAAGPQRPSPEELDRLDRMKTGPRRQAGPPLGGDTPEPTPMEALPRRDLTPPTDPKE